MRTICLTALLLSYLGGGALSFGSIVTTVGFAGAYAPENWTFDTGIGDGYLDVSTQPEMISIYGSDANTLGHVETSVSFTFSGGGSGSLSFDWRILSEDFWYARDNGYYSINGVETALLEYPVESNFGTTGPIPISSGDTVRFFIRAIDDNGGRGILRISEFTVVPEPSFFSVALGIGALIFIHLKATNRKAVRYDE